MVSKKGQLAIGAFVILFLGVMIGLALIPQIAENTNEMTNKFNVNNESNSYKICRTSNSQYPTINNTGCNITVSLAPTVFTADWRKTQCPMSAVTVRNCTGNALTATTDYIYEGTTGVVELKNTTSAICGAGNRTNGNNTFIYYSYCTAGYVTDSAGRSVVGLITIFAALALVAFAIFYSVKQFF